MRVQDARGKATTEHLNDDTRADAVDSERRTIMGLAAGGLVGVLMGVLCNAASATPGDTILMMDRLVSAEMSRHKIPGMAVAVVKNGEVVVAKGYGFANLEHQVPVTTRSIFQSGSVGKQFTAAAIMLLEEQGKLRLDDKIANYLPRTKARWGSITLRHLLTHTSGIPEYEDEVDDHRSYSERQLTELVGLLSRSSPPGQKYSNTVIAAPAIAAL